MPPKVTAVHNKNNQSLFSNVYRDIPTRKTMDSAGNLVNLRFRHYLLTLGLGFLGLHWRPMTDFIYPAIFNELEYQ